MVQLDWIKILDGWANVFKTVMSVAQNWPKEKYPRDKGPLSLT